MSGSTSSNYIPRAASPLGQPWTPLQEEEIDPLNGMIASVPNYSTSSNSPSPKPITLYNTNRSGQSAGIEQRLEEQQQQQQQREQEERMQNPIRPASTVQQIDFQQYSDVLPKLGDSQDAQAALDKLDKLEKSNAQKRKWPKLKKDKIEQSPQSKKGKEAGDHDDEDSISSSLNLYGEVRLAISSMPGFTVLTKARQALDSSDRPDSPPGDDSTSNRASLPFRFGSQRRKSSASPAPESLQNVADHLLVNAQTDGVPSVPIGSVESAKGTRPIKSAGVATADLMPLKEERKIEEATDVLSSDTITPIKPAPQLIKPKPERPRLMLQTASAVSEGSMMQSPEDIVPQSNALSELLQRDRDQQTHSPFNSGVNRPASTIDQSPSPGPCDADALKAADQARKNLSRPSMFDEPLLDDVVAASIGSPSSIGSGSDSEESDISSEGEAETEDQVRSLNLEHGEELTRKQKKKILRNLRRERRRRIAKGGVRGGGEEDDNRHTVDGTLGPAISISKRHKRTASLTNHISTGLHYASSQSRNRRAMEKYSPHPSRPPSAKPFQNNPALAMSQMSTPPFGPTQMNGSISRSSTPANVLGSERSSISEEMAKEAIDSGSRPSSVRNGIMNGDIQSPEESTEDDANQKMFDQSRNLLKRWGTNNSTTSTLMPSSSIKGSTFKSRFLSLRRGARQQPSDVMEEDPDNTPQQEQDAEKELDKALDKLVAEEAPEELGERFEFDVLYENQRGMLFFGIPKFSSKTLFQWDPAPWTNSRNKNSAYNVVNAQLPNPSWEWVHPEWMIDMSGDVDESGWQYSYNFGRLNLNIFNRPTQIIPRANVEGNEATNQRFQKTMKDMEKDETNREDDGFEALKRTAITRQAKWSGIPTQNTYVRRRRWIRLRRRKPLDIVQHTSNTPKVGTPMGVSRASNDWSQLVKSETTSSQGLDKKVKAGNTASPIIREEDEDDSLSNFEEGSSASSSSSGSSDMEDANLQGESGFYARRTTGDLKSGSDPTQVRETKEHLRRKRHAKEFTGTIRELKSLLPSILDRRGGRSHRSTNSTSKTANDRQKSLWLMEIDARNPFISWSFVKRRLEDDDLAFASTSLRARERRYAQRQLEKRARNEKRRKSSTISIASGPIWEQFELTRDALIEINFRRVSRVLKACKLDRQKLQLWKVWLNVDPLNTQIEPSRNEDLIELGLAASSAAASESLIRAKEELAKLAKTRWRSAFAQADPIDVWDVIERRLDRLLLTFEYQHGRAQFLRMLLTIHASSHPNHRFKPGQTKIGGSAVPGSEPAVEADAPAVLSPIVELGRQNTSVAGDEWRIARVPRLEFWSDLIDCARGLIRSGAATQVITSSNGTSNNNREIVEFLQLPAHKQHSLLLQTRSSVFKDKIHSQTAEDHQPHMEESGGSKFNDRRSSIISSTSPPPLRTISTPPIQHDRADSDVVRRLSEAIGDD